MITGKRVERVNGRTPGLDWQEAYARLERIERALGPGGDVSPDDAARILKERAKALARPRETVAASVEGPELVVFTLAGERYGVETAHVQDVAPLRGLTPLPGVPSLFPGVVLHRGRVLPVVDLRRLFDLAGRDVPEGSRLIVAEAAGMIFGLFADTVAGVVRADAPGMTSPPEGRSDDRQSLIRGVTGEMIAVLDLEALARDPRFAATEEVG